MSPERHPLLRCQNTSHPKRGWCAGLPRYRLELRQDGWELVPAQKLATHCKACGMAEVAARNAQLTLLLLLMQP
jgi:hypothetical protein